MCYVTLQQSIFLGAQHIILICKDNHWADSVQENPSIQFAGRLVGTPYRDCPYIWPTHSANCEKSPCCIELAKLGTLRQPQTNHDNKQVCFCLVYIRTFKLLLTISDNSLRPKTICNCLSIGSLGLVSFQRIGPWPIL